MVINVVIISNLLILLKESHARSIDRERHTVDFRGRGTASWNSSRNDWKSDLSGNRSQVATGSQAKMGKHDKQIQVIIEAIRQLMAQPPPKKRRIGFIVSEKAAKYGH